jgi:hypothetical protein
LEDHNVPVAILNFSKGFITRRVLVECCSGRGQNDTSNLQLGRWVGRVHQAFKKDIDIL